MFYHLLFFICFPLFPSSARVFILFLWYQVPGVSFIQACVQWPRAGMRRRWTETLSSSSTDDANKRCSDENGSRSLTMSKNSIWTFPWIKCITEWLQNHYVEIQIKNSLYNCYSYNYILNNYFKNSLLFYLLLLLLLLLVMNLEFSVSRNWVTKWLWNSFYNLYI